MTGSATLKTGTWVEVFPLGIPSSMIFDTPVKIVPLEELVWQKAYIMERERFDGADIAHLLLKCGERIDWEHILRRFGPTGGFS